MSTEMHGIGLRMLSVRKGQGLTQAIVAAQLGISTKTYVFYEQERREIPASTAVKFCQLYREDINWLLTGIRNNISAEFWAHIEETVRIVLDWNEREQKGYSHEKIGSLVQLIAAQSRAASQSPAQAADAILKVM